VAGGDEAGSEQRRGSVCFRWGGLPGCILVALVGRHLPICSPAMQAQQSSSAVDRPPY
jgi:hypothetical protein